MRRKTGTTLAAVAALAFTGCDSDDDGSDDIPISERMDVNMLVLQGSVSTLAKVEVMDLSGLSPVTGALVSVNGNVLPYNSAESAYMSTNFPYVTAGTTIALSVNVLDRTVGGSIVMPSLATVTEPNQAHGPYVSGQPITVQWSDVPSDPDGFMVQVPDAATLSGDGWQIDLSEDSTETVIPGGTLASGCQFNVTVMSVNVTENLSGYATSDSSITAMNASFSEEVETQ